MASEGFFGLLFEMLMKLQAFVLRTNVQIQLVVILAILFGIGFLSEMVIVAVGRRQKMVLVTEKQADGTPVMTSRDPLARRMLSLGISLLLFPVLGLITTYIMATPLIMMTLLSLC